MLIISMLVETGKGDVGARASTMIVPDGTERVEAMVETFERLKAVAADLNTASDSLNENLQKIQEKLNRLNLGMEVWPSYRTTQLVTFDKEPVVEEIYGVNKTVGSTWWETYLGYAKTENGWGLAIRDVQYRLLDGQVEEVMVKCSPKPLLKASREIRLEAAGVIEELYQALLSAVEDKMAKVKKAKQLAEGL